MRALVIPPKKQVSIRACLRQSILRKVQERAMKILVCIMFVAVVLAMLYYGMMEDDIPSPWDDYDR